MNAKSDLIQARRDMLAVLDAKLAKMPEWRAFRAIESAISAIDSPQVAREANGSTDQRPRVRHRVRLHGESYGDLAIAAMNETGAPVPTADMVAYIATRRELDPDPKKARINIQSALSKDERVHSVPWRGARAWWYADRGPPTNESAGQSLNP